MESRLSALTARLDAMDARFDSLLSQQDTNTSTLSELVEAQQAIIASVTSFNEKFDMIIARLEKLSDFVTPKTPSPRAASSGASSLTPSSSASRKSKARIR